ncbi:TBC-domain-containing protein [Microthyrium microscopicum]|uniref:TBC-domain-containing protein n=1 Tax=Microthyrium microscopicum TaxID=703497 RepID=A0A6A6UTZ1_9PEZI|nr:TBC-domain-containing protein [Microthyrium microscopicum]
MSQTISPNTDFDTLLRRGPQTTTISTALSDLRYKVLIDGIPASADGQSDIRIYLWLILLDSPPVSTDVYIDLVHQGSSPAYSKIRNDTFRTLATDPLFRRKVSENSLTRVLNAVAWKLHDAHEARVNGWLSPPTLNPASSPPPPDTSSLRSDAGGGAGGSQAGEKTDYVGYVQGMNVLAAPFLYVARSEAEAFAAFDAFIRRECPGYIRGSMEGVHRGLALVDEVLGICDPKLYAYLTSKGLHASIYAFPSVLTMCACTPPLPEVLQLWDFLFAYGMHLNILCIVAQLVLIRDQILSAERYVDKHINVANGRMANLNQSKSSTPLLSTITSQ